MIASLYQSGSLDVSLPLCAMRLTFDAQNPTRNQAIVAAEKCWTKSSLQIKTRDCHRAVDLVVIPDLNGQIQNSRCRARQSKETCPRHTAACAISPGCAAARAWSAE